MAVVGLAVVIFLRFYLFIFRERKGWREGKKHQCVVASHASTTGNLAHNPGMCPDWELNRQPFDSQADTQPLSLTSQGYFFFKQSFFFKILFIYFLKRGKGGRKRGRETSICCCLSHGPHWGPGLQPKHVPWLGIKQATLWFAGLHSIHWTTPAKAKVKFLNLLFSTPFCPYFVNGLNIIYVQARGEKEERCLSAGDSPGKKRSGKQLLRSQIGALNQVWLSVDPVLLLWGA